MHLPADRVPELFCSCSSNIWTKCGEWAKQSLVYGVVVQEHLTDVLPSILDGLADEAEGVRDAALAAGRTFVDLYAETALPLLLPAVEDGILNDNWRIRQSSVELLGQLLFKVCHRIAIKAEECSNI